MAVSTAGLCSLWLHCRGCGDGGGYGAGGVEEEEASDTVTHVQITCLLYIPHRAMLCLSKPPWASVSGTAVAQVFPSVSGRLGYSDGGTTASEPALTHSCPIQSTDSPLSASTTGVLLFSVLNRWRGGQWSVPREKEFNSAKGFLLTYPSLLPSPPQFCVVVNPYRDTFTFCLPGEPHHLSDGFSDASSSFFLLWLCRGKAE